MAEFDEAMWYALVDKVVVEDMSSMRYIFKNGAEITVTRIFYAPNKTLNFTHNNVIIGTRM